MIRSVLFTAALSVLVLAPASGQDDPPPAMEDAGGAAAAGEDGSNLITLNVRDTSLGQIIELISVQQEVNIVAGVDTNRPVTVNFYEASLEEALDWILTPLGLGWYYDGKIYTILESNELDLIQKPLVERIFYPNYRSAAELQSYLAKFLSPYGSIIVSEAPNPGLATGESETGGIDSTGQEMIIVIDNEESIERIERLVATFDQRPRQVLVEATILEVKLDETNRFGVDFNLVTGGVDFDDFEELFAPQQVFSAPTSFVPGEFGPASIGTGAPFLAPSGTRSINQAGFTEGPGSDGMRIGYVGNDVSFFLEALQSVVDTNVLANTKVLALNKMRAELIIGGRLGYFGGTTVSDGISQQTVEFLEVGTQLRFRPFIGSDGFVRLEVHPERSSGIVDPVTGLPTESTSEVTTNIMVRDGETVVIGGLIETREVQNISRVPILGYIPLLGWLFSKEETEVERTETIVMITPHVLEDGETWEDGQMLLDEAAKRSDVFVDGFGPVARRTHAARTMKEAQEALDKGKAREARSLCDRVMALDPLADGLIELSNAIDARLADDRQQRQRGTDETGDE